MNVSILEYPYSRGSQPGVPPNEVQEGKEGKYVTTVPIFTVYNFF